MIYRFEYIHLIQKKKKLKISFHSSLENISVLSIISNSKPFKLISRIEVDFQNAVNDTVCGVEILLVAIAVTPVGDIFAT